MKINVTARIEDNSLIFYVDKEGHTEYFVRTLDIEDVTEEE